MAGLSRKVGFFDTAEMPRQVQQFEQNVDLDLNAIGERIDALRDQENADTESLQDQIDVITGDLADLEVRVAANESEIERVRKGYGWQGNATATPAAGGGNPFEFDTRHNNGGAWTLSASGTGTLFTCNVAGIYLFGFNLYFNSDQTSNPQSVTIKLQQKNTAGRRARPVARRWTASTGDAMGLYMTHYETCNVGDSYEWQADTGGTLTASSVNDSRRSWIARIGDIT